jgi:tRNA (cmo5U34)-methyltransferase
MTEGAGEHWTANLADAMNASSRDFFENISADYTAAIDRCVPRSREMRRAILHYLPAEWKPSRILELGCGSGNLSELLCRRFSDASIRLVDFSWQLLEQSRNRLSEFSGIEYQEEDFRNLEFAPGSIDLSVSSISLHYLTHDAKADLFGRMFVWLDNGGALSYSDQFAGVTDDLYARQMADWKERSIQLGASSEEWDAWMEHQEAHDHHATLISQIEWLRKAGFTSIDCTWRYILWTVLQARKWI